MDKKEITAQVEQALLHDEKAIEALYKSTYPMAYALYA